MLQPITALDDCLFIHFYEKFYQILPSTCGQSGTQISAAQSHPQT